MAFLVVLVIIATVGGLNYVQIRESVTSEATAELASQATARAAQQGQWVREMESQTQLISGTVEPFALSLSDAQQRSATTVAAIHYVNLSRETVRASTDRRVSGRSFSQVEAPWVSTLEERPITRSPETLVWATDRSYVRDGTEVISFVSPTGTPNEAVVVVGDNEQLNSQYRNGSTLSTAVYTSEGTRLFGDPAQSVPLNESLIGTVIQTQEPREFRTASLRGVYAPVAGTDWIAVTAAQTAELFQTSNAVSRSVVLIISTSTILLVILGLALGRHTVVPLERLGNRAQELAASNFDIDLHTAREDEIGDLYGEFSAMRDALHEQMEATESARTELEAQRDSLQELTTRFELALEETNTGVWEWDMTTDEVVWDEASKRLFGFTSTEFPGTQAAFRDRVHQDDLPDVEDALAEAIENESDYNADFRIVLPDGTQRWIHSRAVPYYDDAGEPERMIGIQTDITDRKHREREVEQANEQLRQIIDLIPDPLYAKNLDDKYLLSNQANAELHGMSVAEMEGVRERDIESDVENITDFDIYRQREISVIETGEPRTTEERLRGPDGDEYVFRTTRIPFATTGHDEEAVLGYARDVTELKAYEQQLETKTSQLEASNGRLEAFAGVVSHDLRNPLGVIQGRTEYLLEQDNAEMSEHYDAIFRAATRMQTLIEDMLDLARAGNDIDTLEPVALAKIAAESWESIDAGESTLSVDVPDDHSVEADADRLQQLFENLFRNALEHNERPLTIRVGLVDPPAGSEATVGPAGFFVEDTGAGIPEEERGSVFEHGFTTSDDGTGMGLSIVDEIASAHGWDISLETAESGGARFEIRPVNEDG
jgi:PAS domain S-box-containing protein